MSEMTDAELELQFQERNKNLKNTLNNLVDSAKDTTQGVAETIQDKSTQMMNNVSQATNSTDATRSNTSMNSSEGLGPFLVDQRMMHSIDHDMTAMKSKSPEGFEPVAAKIDETFGSNALNELK